MSGRREVINDVPIRCVSGDLVILIYVIYVLESIHELTRCHLSASMQYSIIQHFYCEKSTISDAYCSLDFTKPFLHP